MLNFLDEKYFVLTKLMSNFIYFINKSEIKDERNTKNYPQLLKLVIRSYQVTKITNDTKYQKLMKIAIRSVSITKIIKVQ